MKPSSRILAAFDLGEVALISEDSWSKTDERYIISQRASTMFKLLLTTCEEPRAQSEVELG